MRGLVRAPELITLNDERLGLRSIGRIRIELDLLERAGCRQLVISDPGFLGDAAGNVTALSLYPLLQERLMRLAPIFADRPLKVGLMIRSFEHYWTSVLAAQIEEGRAQPQPNVLDYLTTQPRHWRHVIRDIAEAFDGAEIHVMPFEAFAGRPKRVLDVLRGIDPCTAGNEHVPSARGTLWLGRSGDCAALNAALSLAGQPPLKEAEDETGQPVQASAQARWMPFGPDHQSVLRAEYQRDLAWLQSGAQDIAVYHDGRTAPLGGAARAGPI